MTWLFGASFKGAAGFGIMAAIVATLLVGLGFPTFGTVLLGLMVQGAAANFRLFSLQF